VRTVSRLGIETGFAGVVALFVVGVWTTPLRAQAVQLPTFSFFTTNTTVSVPDRGGAYFGGVNRASSGSVRRGIPGLGARPFNNRGFGASRGAGGLQVVAQIHDMQELDDAVLGRGAAIAAGRSIDRARQPFAGVQVGATGMNAIASMNTIERERRAQDLAKLSEAATLLERGRQAISDGKPGVAKIYLQMAARRDTGAVRDQATRLLDSLAAPAKSKLVGAR